MLTPDPANTAVRDRRRTQKLGDNASCSICGESDPVVLVVDKHHVAGRVNDENLTVTVCRNDHARQTERLAALGVPMRYHDGHITPTPLDRLAAVLAGAGAFLAQLSASLIGWARWLASLTELLDANWSEWRTAATRLPDSRGFVPVMWSDHA